MMDLPLFIVYNEIIIILKAILHLAIISSLHYQGSPRHSAHWASA